MHRRQDRRHRPPDGPAARLHGTARTTAPHARLLAAGALLALLLVGCRAAPIPVAIDLLPELGDAARGEAQFDLESGSQAFGELRLPTDGPVCFDYEVPDEVPVQVAGAALDYRVDIAYTGPELTGTVQAQLYLAAPGTDLWREAARFGPPVEVDLAQGGARLDGTANLARHQIDTLLAGEACFGATVGGGAVSATESGTGTLAYEVQRLRLRVGVALF